MSKKKLPTNIISSFLDDIKSVQNNPRFQIIICNGVLELFVEALIHIKCKNKQLNKQSHYTHSIKIDMLYEMGVLSEYQYKLLYHFRKLRNDAAHGSEFVLNEDHITGLLRTTHFHDPKAKSTDLNLTAVFHYLVMNFWDDFTVDLHEYFFKTKRERLKSITFVNSNDDP